MRGKGEREKIQREEDQKRAREGERERRPRRKEAKRIQRKEVRCKHRIPAPPHSTASSHGVGGSTMS